MTAFRDLSNPIQPMELYELEKFIERAISSRQAVVNLSHRGLRLLTDGLSAANDAQALLLNNNQLLMLPDDLGRLAGLTELVLDHNMLTMLPSGKVFSFFAKQ